MIEKYTAQYAECWENCPVQVPHFARRYSNEDKLQKENYLNQFLETIKTFRKDRVRGKLFKEEDQKVFLKKMRGFLSNGLDFSDIQLELMFSDSMIGITRSFIQKAKTFDADLTFADIFQACRNMWIMNGLQLIMGIPMKVTPSVFAYSMLYPYTDNFIDDPAVSGYQKLQFSERFRHRLSGTMLNPGDKTENAIFRLVGMIEEEYPRTDYPEVYASLLAIHDAQTRSVELILRGDSISKREILNICLAKGGASVLADGYLVAGKLTDMQQYFLFGYGAYLQLLDDVQDVKDDYASGLMTVFSGSACRSPLDEKLNKTYWFGEHVMKSLDSFGGQHIDLFKSLMRRSMDLFIAEAIAQTPEMYSEKYVAEYECCSPFHFSYIRKLKTQFESYNSLLLTAVEEFAFSDNLIMSDL